MLVLLDYDFDKIVSLHFIQILILPSLITQRCPKRGKGLNILNFNLFLRWLRGISLKNNCPNDF
jgi:hypothetical protein